MEASTPPPAREPRAWSETQPRRRGCLLNGLLFGGGLLVVIAVTVVVTLFAYRYYLGRQIEPTVLSEPEQEQLALKIEALETGGLDPGVEVPDPELEARSARDARTVTFTEKEINGWLNHNTDLGESLYIDFARDRITGRLVHTFDGDQEDLPLVGGRTLRAALGVESYLDEDGSLRLVIRSLSIGGVPVPNAWMFDLKGRDVIGEFGEEVPLLRSFERGIEDLEIRDGEMRVILAE